MRVLVSAGEVSGDVHGSYLVKELKKLKPDLYFFGMGSERLAAEGVDIKFDISRRGTVGIFEALPNLFSIYSTFNKMKALLLKEKPDLVLLIDSQGFNLPFAKFCKENGFKTVYYIAPQEWLWGTLKGAKKVAETVDLIVAIFEKEYAVYKNVDGRVVYFGHPLIDIVKPSLSKEEARSKFLGKDAGIEAGGQKPVVCLCPGSRSQEIKSLFPILLKSAKIIQKEFPRAQFLIPAATKEIYNKINSLIVNYKVLDGQTYDAIAASDLAICTSGTINLEASLLGIPNIMTYKLSAFTYFIGKHVLRIDKKIKYFSMPNILLDEKVIPELVMQDANPQKIADETIAILKDPARQEKMKRSFITLKEKLGQPGVIARVARAVLS